MKKVYLYGSIALIAVATSMVIWSARTSSQDIEWEFSYDFIGACRCKIPCGCAVGELPNDEYCEGLVFYHITEGHFGDVSLDGLNMGVAVRFPPGNQPYLDGGGEFAFYVDESASDAQREVLAGLLMGIAEPIMSTLLGVKYVPIEFKVVDAKTQTLTIPDILELKSVVIDEEPFPTIYGPETFQAEAQMHVYKDHGMEWEYSGRSSAQAKGFMSSELPTSVGPVTWGHLKSRYCEKR